jgi:hypothetical protein
VILDNLLIAIIIVGIGLSGAYLRAELLLHRRTTALQSRTELMQLELRSKKVRPGQNDMPRQPRTVQASVFEVMRALARALRTYLEERIIHRFWIRT